MRDGYPLQFESKNVYRMRLADQGRLFEDPCLNTSIVEVETYYSTLYFICNGERLMSSPPDLN